MIDWTAVGSIATALAVLVAVVAIVVDGRRSRCAAGVDLIMRLNNQFGSATFRKTRCNAARYLRDTDDYDNPCDALYDVLNFFAMVAYLRYQGVLDSFTIWYTFGEWLIPYYRLSEPIIARWQKLDPTDYGWLTQLCEEIRRIDQQKRHYTVLPPLDLDEENARFLDDECNLLKD